MDIPFFCRREQFPKLQKKEVVDLLERFGFEKALGLRQILFSDRLNEAKADHGVLGEVAVVVFADL